MFFDVHAHLTSKEYNSVEEVIKKCSEKSIFVINNGLDYEDNNKVLKLGKKYKNVFSCLGMHPCVEFDERIINQIRNNKNKIIGLGEVGLDFSKGFNQEQIHNFKKIIRLSQDLNLPLIIHSRKAQEKVLELVKDIKTSVILHAFLTKKSLIKQAIEFPNVYLTIPANAVYSTQVQNMIEITPLNKILCETDSPYMWKHGLNTPLNVLKSYEKISEIKEKSSENVEKTIQRTFQAIFKNVELIQ